LYLTWKAYGLTKGKTIQILGAELSEDGLSVKGEAFEMLTAERNSWEAGGMEGQCIVQHNGYLYMLYSGNSCCGGQCDYQVGVARAKSMKGPWEKYEQNPILKGNNVWKCPGHGTAVQTKDSWYYLYHAYNEKGFPYLGRSAMLGEMLWNEKSGWPYFDTTARIDGTQIKQDLVEKFDTDSLGRWWKYDVPGYKFNASVAGGRLNLTETGRKNSVGAAVCVSPDYADFTMSATVAGKNAALKGLVLYATGSNSVGIGVKNDSLILWKVKDDRFIELNTLHVANNDQLHLKADIVDGHLGKYYYSIDGTNWTLVTNKADNQESVNGDNLAWWSWGVKAGLFVKADSISGNNTATFDDFGITYK
jgi:beta-xylosidase